MELISPRQSTAVQELKQELFLRAEELERLVAIYKLKLCGEEMNSLNYGSKLMEQSNTLDVLGEQRGQFYDIYMRKREVKLREERRARGAQKEAEMRAMKETLDSTSSTMMGKGKVTESKNNHSRQINSRKLSSSRSTLSSSSQSSATTTENSTIRSSNSALLRKENSKTSTGISNGITLQRNIDRSQSSNDRMSLVKDIKARSSQSLRKNSVSLGEPNDFIHLKSGLETSTQPVHSNLPRSGSSKPLLRKSNGSGLTAGLGAANLRMSMASQASISEENQLVESTEMLKEANEQVDSMRIEDAQNLRLSKEPLNSAYHRFPSNGQVVESPKLKNSHVQKFLFDVCDASELDSSADSQCFDSVIRGAHNMNQYMEGKTVRVRKKWGSVERPFVDADAPTNSIMDATKGLKRFLKFGKRRESIVTHNDKEDDHDSENYSFESPRNSRLGQIQYFGDFNEDETHYEQVKRPHNSIHSASLKERQKRLLANSPKLRVLSSLPPFRVRENEHKSR